MATDMSCSIIGFQSQVSSTLLHHALHGMSTATDVKSKRLTDLLCQVDAVYSVGNGTENNKKPLLDCFIVYTDVSQA